MVVLRHVFGELLEPSERRELLEGWPTVTDDLGDNRHLVVRDRQHRPTISEPEVGRAHQQGDHVVRAGLPVTEMGAAAATIRQVLPSVRPEGRLNGSTVIATTVAAHHFLRRRPLGEADVLEREIRLRVVRHGAHVIVLPMCPGSPWEVVEMAVRAGEDEADGHHSWLGQDRAVAVDVASLVRSVGAGMVELELARVVATECVARGATQPPREWQSPGTGRVPFADAMRTRRRLYPHRCAQVRDRRAEDVLDETE